MSNYSIVKQSFDPKSLPITIESIKVFLKIDASKKDPDQDKLLTKLALIATQHAENCINQSILNNRFLLSFNGITTKIVRLPFKPILSITSVKKYKKNSKNFIELKQGKDYFINIYASLIIFVAKILREDRIEVLYETGYKNTSSLSLQIQDGILKHIYFMYKSSDSIENMNLVEYTYSNFKDIKISF